MKKLIIVFLLLGCSKANDPAPVTVPKISMDGVDFITPTRATAHGNLITDGNSPIISMGFVWSYMSPLPTTKDDMVVVQSGRGRFDADLTGLYPGTPYYVRAFVVTEYQYMTYSNVVTFTTK